MRGLFILLTITYLIPKSLTAQWVQTIGPYGGDVRCFATIGTNLFLGTWGSGVFLSTDNGARWNGANNGLTRPNVNALTTIGTNLFAGTNDGGVFLSTDNGAHWTPARVGLPSAVYALAAIGTSLFAGTWGQGVFMSTDNGARWVRTGLTGVTIWCLASSGLNLFAGTNGGVYRSTDNGISWEPANAGMTNAQVLCLATVGTSLFAGTWGLGVFVSTDNGTSWTTSHSGLTNTIVHAIAAMGPNLFAGTYGGGVFLSSNAGAGWTAVKSGLTNRDVKAFATMDTRLFVGTFGGVYLFDDIGESWTQVNNGLTSTKVQAFATIGGDVFAGGAYGGVFRSTDDGTSWVNTGLTDDHVHAFATVGTRLFAGASTGVFCSTDSGTSWKAMNTGLMNSDVYAFATVGTNIFAGTWGGVYLSTDSGEHWTAVNYGLTDGRIQSIVTLGTNLFSGTLARGVFRSTDNGTSWTAVNAGLTNNAVRCLTAIGTYLFTGTWGGGIFLSTDSGASWSAVNSGLTSMNVKAFVAVDTVIFAGTDSGVFLSTDIGESWTALNGGLTNVNAGVTSVFIDALAANDTNLFAGTHGGVYRLPLSAKGKIGGVVYHDLDRNGGRSENEPAIEGWSLTLTLPADQGEWNVPTDSNGRYRFRYLESGEYVLTVNPPPGWFWTHPDGNRYFISFERDSVIDDLDFGWGHARGEIRGLVFDDFDGNGARDSGEPGLRNWGVTLAGALQTVTQTDDNGEYAFGLLDSGRYIVTVAQSGFRVVTYPDTIYYSMEVGFDSLIQGKDFGIHFAYTMVEGSVFDDQNDNGIRDSTEAGLADWPVVCTSFQRDDTLQTDADGRYLFRLDYVGDLNVATVVPQEWEQIWPRGSQAYEYHISHYGEHTTGFDFAVHRIPPRVKLALTVKDRVLGSSRQIRFGVRPGATYGIWGVDSTTTNIDFSEGEFEIPPVLPGMFEARFIDPGQFPTGCFGQGSWTDMRDYLPGSQIDTYQVYFAPGYVFGGDYPMTIRWEQDAVGAGYAGEVLMAEPHGSITDMKTVDSLVIADSTIHTVTIIAENPILTATSAEEEVADIPSGFRLEQNYPNPFNPATTIRYALPEAGHVRLRVFNLLGQAVKDLVNEFQEPGYRTVSFDAGGLPSGVYTYRLTAGKFTGTNRMLLLK